MCFIVNVHVFSAKYSFRIIPRAYKNCKQINTFLVVNQNVTFLITLYEWTISCNVMCMSDSSSLVWVQGCDLRIFSL
jgi:hypothetical protein